MTKRQANTLMALGLTAILTQILCTVVLLCGLDRIRKEAAAAQASAMAGLEMKEKLVERDDMKLSKVVMAEVPTTQPAHGTAPAVRSFPPYIMVEVEPIRLKDYSTNGK